MTYEIRIGPSAERAIGKLPVAVQLAVLDKLAELAQDPRPAGCELEIRFVPSLSDSPSARG